MRILICDDNIYSANKTKDIIMEYFDGNEIDITIDMENDSRNIIDSDKSYDMAFLDVEMPHHNGLEVASYLKKQNSESIIFMITSYPHYLDEAFDLKVFRYLPKPPDKERIFNGLDSALKFYLRKTRVVLIEGNRATRVYIKDILYIMINKRKTLVVTKYGDYTSEKTLEEWKSSLPEEYFSQPHYSYLVNLQNITKLEKDFIILDRNKKENVSVKISQRRYKEFKTELFDFFADCR